MTHVTTNPSAPRSTDLADLVQRSVSLIGQLQHPSGAYPASPTFSAYRGYSWFRDGAFIADAMSAAGAVDSASRFFDWCDRMLAEHSDDVAEIVAAEAAGAPLPDDRMLPTRFTLDGSPADDDWWDFQTDGYGTWVWAAISHAHRHGLSLDRWQSGIRLSVDYLIATAHRPCYDWWEEHPDKVHISTLGCIVAGLQAAVDSGVLGTATRARASAVAAECRETVMEQGTNQGHLVKWVGSTEVDASLLGIIAPLGVVEATSALGLASIRAIDDQLNVDGGVHRYLDDTFFGGGQWPLLSCMLGLAQAAAGDRGSALAQLEWAARTETEHGFVPEQVDRHVLAPDRQQEWIDRWGPVATPLVWSHAMIVRLAVELGVAGSLPVEAGVRAQ